MAAPPARVAATLAALPDEPGVYRFRDARGRVLYVGRAVRLRRRVRSYGGDLRDRRRLIPVVARVAEVEALVCRTPYEAAWLERTLLLHGKPCANRAIGGSESEVFLRLHEDSLRVVHDPPADFGPFLGLEQVRLAVAGIHRAVPLRYGRPRGGSERAMAQARGAVDAEAMSALVTAALSRDADAIERIAGTLARIRDEQSAALRFKRAAQLQAQLEAFRWVTSEQHVIGVVPTDFDAAGWCDGVLVRLRFRDGRLCEWHRRSCTAASAAPALDATPPPWRGFARRAADLAAALRRAADGAAAPDRAEASDRTSAPDHTAAADGGAAPAAARPALSAPGTSGTSR